MRPTLKHKPGDYTFRHLIMSYVNASPLSCDQYHFIYQHEKTLTSPKLTALKRYYLRDYYAKQDVENSFLLPHEKLNAESIKELKLRIQILIEEKNAFIQFPMKPDQFLQLREISVNELIFYHGNHFLTGAPFYPGGIPHVLFFQWGDLFGVAKYLILLHEKAPCSNVLMYFEKRNKRQLDQCVYAYHHAVEHQLPLTSGRQFQQSIESAYPFSSHASIKSMKLF